MDTFQGEDRDRKWEDVREKGVPMRTGRCVSRERISLVARRIEFRLCLRKVGGELRTVTVQEVLTGIWGKKWGASITIAFYYTVFMCNVHL